MERSLQALPSGRSRSAPRTTSPEPKPRDDGGDDKQDPEERRVTRRPKGQYGDDDHDGDPGQAEGHELDQGQDECQPRGDEERDGLDAEASSTRRSPATGGDWSVEILGHWSALGERQVRALALAAVELAWAADPEAGVGHHLPRSERCRCRRPAEPDGRPTAG
jgi:hypothetical protein